MNAIPLKSIKNLTNQTKFRLNEITKTENNFNQEINPRTSSSKNLSKDVTTFDYTEVLIVLSATSDGISIISLTSIVGAPVGIATLILL